MNFLWLKKFKSNNKNSCKIIKYLQIMMNLIILTKTTSKININNNKSNNMSKTN